MPTQTKGIGAQIADVVKEDLRDLASAAGKRALSSAGRKVGSVTDRLGGLAGGEGGPGLSAAVTGVQKMAEGKSPMRAAFSGGLSGVKEKVKGMFGGGKGGRGKKLKVTNIEETVDVGVPVRVAYNQWTQFADFPSFMKKVESVEQASDEKTNWKAQVFWSHRTWEATISQQIPDYNIVWKSKGPKGHVDGSVTFHDLRPNLTRIILAMEYHPQGFFEHTGNLWRAQGRRARLELKHYRRHVMTQTILDPDSVEGWRGEIRDGEVVKDDETARREEEEQQQQPEERGEEDEEEEEEGEEGEEEEEEGEEEEEEREGPEDREEREPDDTQERGEQTRQSRLRRRPERPERAERAERPERPERSERPVRRRLKEKESEKQR
ncbi:SRPBCC family protein [Dactylosporangium darangshiense]|uniref:Coenzyme Q-binding protein COQ10 START domain-containing protein n=1 Tax=Dactylosporangium darangshiense TaxID=579108 RepID=A0ABP8DDY9_9ACTN